MLSLIIVRAWQSWLLFVLVSLACTGCNPPSAAPGDKKLKVVSTVGMIDDLVRNIGGGHVESIALMGPGTDPHLYNPTARDVDRLTKADVVFYVGLHLEGRMQDILEKLEGSKKATAVSSQVPAEELIQPAELEGKYDPHIWFDVVLWRKAAENVAERLAEADPDKAETYKANLAVYLEKLDLLHKEVGLELNAVPADQRVLVTAHDAFGYFGKRYGFEVRGIQGTSTSAEAGIADIRKLADFLAARKIRTIFVESSVPRATIEALQKAVASRGRSVQIGGTLFSDAMGDAGTPEGTYIGMVRHNVKAIVEGLAP